METRNASVLMHLARPVVSAEIREIVRVAGVARVRPGAKLPKLLLVDYDPAVVAAQSLVAHARRRSTATQLIGM
ncbi:MAG TPA: hypothetical protein VML91_12435 [Burkholderiales bacterium]|nr:hypothetical protein [Burkholderiales bacterium]